MRLLVILNLLLLASLLTVKLVAQVTDVDNALRWQREAHMTTWEREKCEQDLTRLRIGRRK